MGDVVLQTATVNWLRSLMGESLRITFVTAQEFVPLLDTHPGINHVIGFDRKKGESWKQLLDKIKNAQKEHKIDLILDLHSTLRSFRLRWSLWMIPSITVDKRRWERFLLTKLKGKFFKRLIDKKVFGLGPQVERIIQDLAPLFSDDRGARRAKDFRKGPNQELTSLGNLPTYSLPGDYIVLAPSASFEPKRWPVESFVELAKNLLRTRKEHLVILAGPQDKFCEAFNEIHDQRLINLQGKTSLKESMSILSKAKLCIGNDSGMNHIAEAHGVPCITLFGPTDPRFGFAPHGSSSKYISHELWCKPCSTTGKSSCFRKSLLCMEMISVEEVLSTLKGLEL